MANINIKANDLEVLWVPPQSDTDARVPTAEELAASSHLHQQNLEAAQRTERPAGLRNRPTFTVGAGTKNLIIPSGLQPYAPGHPSLVPLASNVTITIPPLLDTVTSISRYDYVYLMAFAGVVDATIDADINLSFDWRAQSGAVQTLVKENTQRLRSFWAIVVSQGATTASAVYDGLVSVGTVKKLTVSKTSAGSGIGGFQIYPLDPNLIDAKIYEVRQDTCELIDLCRVWRVQNYNQAGYVWGRTGEANFEADYHIQPTYRYVGDGWEDWTSRSRETMRRLLLGLPITNAPTYDRAVSNLLNGQVGSNADAPGLATASPNGSTALANGQRVTFTNQAVTQKYYALPATTTNAGGVAQASVPFQTNAPSGAYFSQNVADHKVYAATGRDVTADGTLTGLGGTGALVWTANSNAIVAPGDVVYVVPGIFYPAGSGFGATGEIERVFRNGLALAAGNVREASVNDIDVYTEPASSETYIAVLGKERAALHYIYKKITVTSSSNGVLAIPGTERGCIAFITGVGAPSGRIDKPVISGLNNSTSYSLLVYHAPPATENWQFQHKVSRYKGTTERAFVDGSRVATAPIAFAHSQGGGNGVFLADGELQYEALAFRLPANILSGAVPHYRCNYRIQFASEGDVGANSFREVWLSQAAGLACPKVGQLVTAEAASDSQSKGMATRLLVGSLTMGVQKLPIQCEQVYQLVVAFMVQKSGDRRLVVVTTNEGNPLLPTGVQFNSDAPGYAGIDTFQLW